MNTNVGGNLQGIMYGCMALVMAMDTGTERSILLAIGMVCLAVIAFATKGSGLSRPQAEEILDASRNLKAVLKAGREQ